MGEDNFQEDEIWDCKDEIMLPNFVSNYGLIAKEVENETSSPHEIADRVIKALF